MCRPVATLFLVLAANEPSRFWHAIAYTSAFAAVLIGLYWWDQWRRERDRQSRRRQRRDFTDRAQ